MTQKLWAAVKQRCGHPWLVSVDRCWGNKTGRGWAGRGGGTATICSDRHDERQTVSVSNRHEVSDWAQHSCRENGCWTNVLTKVDLPAAQNPRRPKLCSVLQASHWTRSRGGIRQRLISESSFPVFHWLETGAGLEQKYYWIMYPNACWELNSVFLFHYK